MTQPPLCYPHPAGHHLSRPPNSDIHETAGLPNNWALDFMAPGGTPFLCPQDDMTVTKWSGHDPALGVLESDIFAWNVYLRSPAGVEYFATHLGDRVHAPGSHVRRGDLLGHVGHWPGDPGRSHTHLGVTHPAGRQAAVARIEAVAQAVMLPFPPAVTWPAVLDGIGAMFVRCDNDPDVQAARIPGLTWVAPKLTGPDVTSTDEIKAWMHKMRDKGLKVGGWIYNEEPITDVASVEPWKASLDFVIYDVEAPYKSDEGGHYEYAAQLVTTHNNVIRLPAAVTSYGAYKTTIDFASFAKAGWPILAQSYGSFDVADAVTYGTPAGGPYPREGVHTMIRSLTLKPRQAVYRPESIDP